MGNTFATELSGMNIDIDLALTYHLQSNHYPPVPLSMIEPCKAAILAYWEDEPYREIPMPEGVFYKGFNVAPAWAIIEQHHLDAWTTNNDYETDDE